MIQLLQGIAASKKQMLHCAFGRQDPVKLLARPLFLFAAEHWRNWIMKKTYMCWFFHFWAFPHQFGPKKHWNKKLDVVRCSMIVKIRLFFNDSDISVMAGSARIRLFRIRFLFMKKSLVCIRDWISMKSCLFRVQLSVRIKIDFFPLTNILGLWK